MVYLWMSPKLQWSIPTTLHEVRSFHGLVLLYWHFIHNFNTIMEPITNCMKVGKVLWSDEAAAASEVIKEKLTTTHVLSSRHACQAAYIQQFFFVIKYKFRALKIRMRLAGRRCF